MRGLPNLGSTCYFNTAVQCLAHVPGLTNVLLRRPYAGPCGITRELSSLLADVWKSDGSPDPRALLHEFRTRFPSFCPGQQHDAQEVFLCFVDILERSMGREYIHKIFNGREIQEITWSDGRSEVSHTFVTIVLTPESPEASLEELIKSREAPSSLEGYVDAKGTVHETAHVQTRVAEWPYVAAFTFACWSWPKPVINLPEVFEGRDLFAVMVHVGSVHGGHYALIARFKDKWYLKDDATVVPIGPPTRGPFYMAFYRLQNSCN